MQPSRRTSTTTTTTARRSTRRKNRQHQHSRTKLPVQCLNARVQELDGCFFEQFTSLLHDDPSQSATTTPSTTIVNLDDVCTERREQLEDLYLEALYTIEHKIGSATTLHSPFEQHMGRYVQQAFRIDNNQHARLQRKAETEKPPIVLFNVCVIEARDLIAKDANGFSDPFCMMGVIPGKRRKELLSPDSAVDDVDSSDADRTDASEINKHGGVSQRLAGSFSRRKNSKKNRNNVDKFEDERSIPAKLIKATSVQEQTLNPKWNEKFQFIVEDIDSDRFHLDIWDHDDERSICDAVSNLNQISSLKGLGRYFKEVTQSARLTHDNQSVDDFLGCVTLRLQDVPSTGVEDWFTLERRSAKSQVSGQVRLKFWLSTKEDRAPRIDEDDNLLDVRQHEALIRHFAVHEIRLTGQDPFNWHGVLPQTALTLLHQHAVQGDLTDVQQAMCYWLAYCRVHSHADLSFAFLCDVLNDLLAKWSPTSLDKDEEDMVGESFAQFVASCNTRIAAHRNVFAVQNADSEDNLRQMIRCLTVLYDSALFGKTLPFHRELRSEVIAMIEKSAVEYFEESRKKAEHLYSKKPCRLFSSLVNSLNQACAMFNVYDTIFSQCLDIDYRELTYRQFDQLLDEYMLAALMDTNGLKRDLSLVVENNEQSKDADILVPIFQLHFALIRFISYRDRTEGGDYKLDVDDNCGRYFDRAISQWLDLARTKAFARVDLSCQMDTKIHVSANDIRHTSSYVDICHLIQQIIDVWERVRIADIRLRMDLTEKFAQDICKITEYYVDKLSATLAQHGFFVDTSSKISNELLDLLCATVNNAEQARRTIADIIEKMHLDDIVQLSTDKWRSSVEMIVDQCDQYISGQIDATFDRLVSRQIPTIRKHIFHLAWSPSACTVEQALKPLIDQLDVELVCFHRVLLHRNFVRLMITQIRTVLRLLHECLIENTGLEPIFYRRLFDAVGMLSEYFHADGKGVALETIEALDIHQTLLSALSLNQTTTVRLIEQYYRDLAKEQNEVGECKFGILNVRAYYNVNAETLVVDVIGAKQVMALDPNGLSDPFVVIELVPRVHFPSVAPVKTKVISKTLNPIFDETFQFELLPEAAQVGVLHFVVMDHDFLRSNDFAGEAYLELADIPGFISSAISSSNSTMRQFNLILIHPNNSHESMIAVLASRKDDKDAQEFVRHIGNVY